MRRMSLLVVLAVWLVAHPVVAQRTARQASSAHSVRQARSAQVASPEAVHKYLASTDTLRNFDPGLPGEVWFADEVSPPDSGFVLGTNWFADQAKATAFALPMGIDSAQVTEVLVWFAYKRDSLTTQTYSVEIMEGTPASGPTGSPLFSASFPLVDIDADENIDTGEPPTSYVLSPPVTVGSSFFVSVDFGIYGEADWGNAAIVSTGLQGQHVPEVWEKWEDGSWHNVSVAWNQNADDGWHLWIEVIVETATGTAVEEAGEIPRALALSSNYPNPFRSATTLRFELPARTEVDLQVIDLLGRTVATLVEGSMEAGIHTVRFEAGSLPSGIYLARLNTGAVTHTRTLVLLR